MPIDLTDRILQPKPKTATPLHPLRRVAQVVLGAVLVFLPVTNIVRIDITSGKFYLLRETYSAQNMILLFYGLTIGAVLLLCVSMIYGRWWCGWICPQTLASDFGDSLRVRFDRFFKSTRSVAAQIVSKTLWIASMVAMAVATAAVVCTYFYPPNRVWHALIDPLADSRVAVHLLIIGSIIAGDLLFVRRHFCRRGCPYGLMISLIGDSKTMTVRYLEERSSDCIECRKCVVVCPMSIDIRDGANQMECIGCGECIDACNDVLPRIKNNPKPGLIELRYGTDPSQQPKKLTRLQKLGLWDTRRLFVVCTSAILIAGFLYALYGSTPTSASIASNGVIDQTNAFVYEHYDLTINNGKPRSSTFSVAIVEPRSFDLLRRDRVISVNRSSKRSIALTLAAKIGKIHADRRYPVTIEVQSLTGARSRYYARTIFYMPTPKGD